MEDYPTSIQTEKNPEAILIGDIGKGWTFDLMNELMQQIVAGAQLIALHKGRYFQPNKAYRSMPGPLLPAWNM